MTPAAVPPGGDSPFELVLLTSPEDFADEHTLIESLFERGLSRLHVHKPRHSEMALERWLLALDADCRARVILHDHPEMAVSFGVQGFHMDAEWFLRNGNAYADSGLSRSATAHSLAEADQLPPGIAYILLSPVFDSFSALDSKSAFSLESLALWLSERGRAAEKAPVYALSGVDADTLPAVKQAGFDGAGVLGGVWNYADPLEAWRRIHG